MASTGFDAMAAQLRAQIEQARARGGSGTDLGRMLTMLAALYFRQEKFDDAVAAGEDALHSMAGALPADHRMVITAKTNLGLYLCPAGKLERAEILLRDAIQTARRTLPGSAELGQALHNLALMCRNNNRWTEAEEAYAEAVSILSNVSGPAVTVTLRDEGIMWSLRGDAARARQSFARARTEVQARMSAEAAAPVLRQLELDVASLTPSQGTGGASVPASSAGDAGGRVCESRMTR